MPSVTPSTDPLWAWDTPAWTIQKMGTTITAGLNLEESLGAAATNVGGSAAAINSFLGQTMDFAVSGASTGTLVTNTFYGGLIYLPEGGVTTKLVVNESAVGTTTHAYGVLVSVSVLAPTVGTVVALTADATSGAIATTASVAWASPAASVTLAPGFYYAGVCFALSATTNVQGLTAAQTVNANLNSAGANVLPRFVTASTGAVTGANPAVGGSLTLAAQSSLGGVYAAIY